ncbi:hypothetical protein EDD86DRAFT_87606 [Gorgonomyces haynaldii]|nr:hypothetical protein EDD86DRAFT_87606 [Gorgonomyces haynaldii]
MVYLVLALILETSDFMQVFISVLELDVQKQVSTWRFDLGAAGTYNSQQYREPFNAFAKKLNVTVGSQQFQIPANVPQTYFNAQMSVALGNGYPNNYPLDNYTIFTVLSAVNEDGPIRVGFSLPVAMQGWKIEGAIAPTSNPLASVFAMTFHRSLTTILYSVLVNIIMWILSLAIFTLTVTLWFRDRKVEPPTIGITVGLLFALPAIRNTQPGAPVIGCTADVAGFFWAMVLVSVSAFLLILNYIVKYRREKPKSTESLSLLVESSSKIA